jgi:hypothetical protein
MTIDERIVAMDAKLDEALKLLRSMAPAAIATDKDLDSRYGDPEVRFDPRDWSGAPCKGRKYSQCPAEFLAMLADALDWMAGKADEKNEMTANDKPKAPFMRADAARARGWMKRIKEGKVTQDAPVIDPDDPFGQNEDVGF